MHPPWKPHVGNQRRKLERTGLGKIFRSKVSDSPDPWRTEELLPSADLASYTCPCEFGLLEDSQGKVIGWSGEVWGAHLHSQNKALKPSLTLGGEKE